MTDPQTCTSQHHHAGHLCILVSKGNIDEVKTLVTNPRFICFNCGRVADDANNLCNPMPLDPN